MNRMNRITQYAAFLCLGLCAAAPALATSEADARAALSRQGYGAIHELEYEDGLWEAEVVRVDGSRGEVVVDGSGRIHDARDGRPRLDAVAIGAALSAAGYREVREIESDGAVWSADAVAADGRRVELRLSGYDGSVLSEQLDD